MAGETILLVEDNVDLATVYAEVLGTLGYRVLPAPSGEEALRVIEREGASIHLLVTDQQLSGMTGTELCRTLRTRGVLLPAIMLSGFPPPARRPAGDGVVAWLQKPLEVDELLGAVRAALVL